MSFKLGKAIDPERVFLTTHSRLRGRWDPNYYRHMTRFRARVKACPFPVEPLARHLTQVQYGISERATSEAVGTPMLRMVNLQNDAWDLAELKYTQMPAAERAPYLLHAGDILFNRTNSKELVGKCQVFDLSGDYVFASYLIRVRTDTAALLPDYVTAFLSLPAGRILIDAVSRQIAGMTNINAEEIRELLVPRPDLPTQARIVAAWKKALAQRERAEAQARQLLAGIDDLLLAELRLKLLPVPSDAIKNRIFHCAFSEITGSRLDPFFHSPLFSAHDSKLRTDKRFARIKAIGHLVRGVVYSSSDERVEGTAIIRANNIDLVTGDLDLQDMVHVRNDLRFDESQKLRKNDILICAASGSKDHAGKVSYITHDIDAFFGGFMMVLRCDGDSAVPEYLAYYMQSGIFRRSIFRHLGGTNINNLSISMLHRLGVILPEKPDQERILERIRDVRAQARALRATAAAQLAAAKQDIEAMILGPTPK